MLISIKGGGSNPRPFNAFQLLAFDQRGNAGARKVVPARPREWPVSVRKRF